VAVRNAEGGVAARGQEHLQPTSAWFALVNRSDADHAIARETLESSRGRLVTSNFVFDEVVTLCLYRLGHPTAVRVGTTLADPAVVDLLRTTPEDERAAWKLFSARADKRYSFTDCTSFVMMKRLGLRRVAAFDDDFRREGFEALP
jgi:predicted nucleic acid-binding protein